MEPIYYGFLRSWYVLVMNDCNSFLKGKLGQKFNYVINYSPSCCSKPIRPPFIFRTQNRVFLNLRAFWRCIDTNTSTTFKAQKGSKDIIKIVHVKKLMNYLIVQFLFSLDTKSILVALYNYGRTVTRTVLMMCLLPFWALNVSVTLPSMQGQKTLRFHKKYLNLCSEDEQRS